MNKGNNMEKLNNNFLDYRVFTGSLDQLPLKKKLMINTINQYSYCVAEEDISYKKSLQDSDVLLPDGIGIVWAGKLLSTLKLNKIAGADVHEHYLAELNLNSGRCFYLGASESTLALIKLKVAINYPNITVGAFSPPFKSAFIAEDNSIMIDAVHSFLPDVLFVGMTAPKQEKWTYLHKEELNIKVICTIGAVFDFYAGTIHRPGKFWVDNGLEWLIRLIKEPKRMAKRYLYYGPIFIYLMITEKIKRSKLSKSS